MKKRSQIEKILENTFVSTITLAVAFGIITAISYQFSTGLAYIIGKIGVFLIVLWPLISVYIANFTRNSILTLCLSMLASYTYDQNSHLFFNVDKITKVSEPKFTITSGLLSNSFYLEKPQIIEVSKNVLDFPTLYVIKAQTSEGWFEQRFICDSESLSSLCEKEL